MFREEKMVIEQWCFQLPSRSCFQLPSEFSSVEFDGFLSQSWPSKMSVAAHCGCACHKSEVLSGRDHIQSFLWQVSHEDKELPFVLTWCLRVRSGTLKFPNTSCIPETSPLRAAFPISTVHKLCFPSLLLTFLMLSAVHLLIFFKSIFYS